MTHRTGPAGDLTSQSEGRQHFTTHSRTVGGCNMSIPQQTPTSAGGCEGWALQGNPSLEDFQGQVTPVSSPR